MGFRKTNGFLTLEDALHSLDAFCPWHNLYPIEVHAEFRDHVLKEVYKRQPSGFARNDLSDWQRVTRPDNRSSNCKTAITLGKEDGFGVDWLIPVEAATQTELGIVYVLTNSVMPGLIKIGHTTQKDAKLNIDQLFTAGVPVPFDIVYACKVGNAAEVEKALHSAFAPARVNPKREFFQIEPEQAIAILTLLHTEEATNEVEQQPSSVDQDSVFAAQQMNAKRPNMDFSEMAIPVGATLESVKGDFTCTVTGPRKVLFEGSEISLTLATKIMYGISYSIRPSLHWKWEGQTLKAIYDQTYNSLD